jgi:hypothetical protein
MFNQFFNGAVCLLHSEMAKSSFKLEHDLGNQSFVANYTNLK